MLGASECPFSGVTSSGRVWRKVPESDARSVRVPLLWRNQFWQNLEEGAGKRCSECCLSNGAVCSIMRLRRVLSSGVSLACGLGDLIPSRPSLVDV